MSDFVGIDVQGIPKVQAILKNAVPVVKDASVDAVCVYLVNALQTDQPTPKHVSREEAYPEMRVISPHGVVIVGYKSWKQFKLVMALVENGKVPYKRTQAVRKGWKKIGSGRNAIVVNEESAAVWAYDDDRQARQLGLVGWKKLGLFLKERDKGIEKTAQGAADKAIKKLDK